MLSELPLDDLIGDPIERNADAFAAFRLIGMNPSDVARHIDLAPLEPLHIALPEARGESELRHVRLVPGQRAQ
jgi:hypothetical protein